LKIARPVRFPPGRARLADEAGRYRIGAGREDNRDRRGGLLRRLRRTGAAGRGYDCDPARGEVGGQGGQPVVMPLGPAVFDPQIAAFDIAGIGEPLAERRRQRRRFIRRPAAEKTDR
jgi:hypothetical protein